MPLSHAPRTAFCPAAVDGELRSEVVGCRLWFRDWPSKVARLLLLSCPKRAKASNSELSLQRLEADLAVRDILLFRSLAERAVEAAADGNATAAGEVGMLSAGCFHRGQAS